MTVQECPPTPSEVAIVVPCYNAERQLQRALDSAFAQSYRDFRVYAVDDGSTDGTVPVLESNSHRCSFVSQRHAGPAAARNRAIQTSDSPFVAFLDADDEWLPSKLERQIALLKQDATLGLVCSGFAMSGEETAVHGALPKHQDIPVSGKLFRNLARSCFVFTPTVVARRSCLEEVGLFHESLPVCEDFNLWLRIAARWRIAVLPEVLAIVHKHPGSLSASISSENRLRTGVVALEHVRSACPDLSRADVRALRAALAERNYFYGSFLLATGAKGPSRPSLAAALRLQPTHWKALAKLGLSFLPVDASKSLAGLKRKFAGH